MRESLVVVGLLLAAGCAGSPRASVRRAATPGLQAGRVAPPEATRAAAGGAACNVGAPVGIGRLDERAAFALAFGAAGGIVAWSTRGGVSSRLLDRTGALAGPEQETALPFGAAPIYIAPFDRGWIVFATRRWRPRRGVTAAGDELFVARLAPDGTARSWAWTTVRDPTLAAVTDVRAGKLLLATPSGDLGIVTVGADDSIALTTAVLPASDFLLTVRGDGPPLLAVADEYGRLVLLDGGPKLRVVGGVRAGAPSRILDARVQARWGADGRVHVAWQAWLEGRQFVQYATIDDRDRLDLDGPALDARVSFRPPFDDTIQGEVRGSVFGRSAWIGSSFDDALDLRDADPAAPTRGYRGAWTGDAFLLLYATSPPSRDNPIVPERTLRAVEIRCAPGG